jgi:hypothetical protein
LAGWLLAGNILSNRFLRGLFVVAALLDIAGTSFAGYLLHSQFLVIAMLAGLLGWLAYVFCARRA